MECTCKNSDYIITFGKHKGKTLGWIANNYPGYIIWLVEKDILWIKSKIVSDCRDLIDEGWDDLQDAAASYSHEDWGCRD